MPVMLAGRSPDSLRQPRLELGQHHCWEASPRVLLLRRLNSGYANRGTTSLPMRSSLIASPSPRKFGLNAQLRAARAPHDDGVIVAAALQLRSYGVTSRQVLQATGSCSVRFGEQPERPPMAGMGAFRPSRFRCASVRFVLHTGH
jgi:hypothetical protein